MSWREQMQQGSFRGVPFYARAADGQLGRRVALHEYPGRDLPYPEDLGKKAGPITLELIVIGPDYMTARDKLIEALNAPGNGVLVHPWRGRLQVSLIDARGPRESTRQGGMASFNCTFVEAGEAVQPTATDSTADSLKQQTANARAQLQSDFATQFDISGPEYLASEAGKLLQQGADRFSALSSQIAAPGQLAAEFVADLGDFSSELTSLLRAPGDLASRMIGLTQDLGNLAEKPQGAFEIYRLFFGWGDDTPAVPTTTTTRQRQATNQSAVGDLIRRTALVEAIEQSASHDYQSTDQAATMRDTLTDQLERETETASDDVYTILVQLRLVLVRDIAARGLVLPRIVHYTPNITLPAIVLAYRLHGDTEREADLVARNGVRHPGFVSGGESLEVLSDG